MLIHLFGDDETEAKATFYNEGQNGNWEQKLYRILGKVIWGTL